MLVKFFYTTLILSESIFWTLAAIQPTDIVIWSAQIGVAISGLVVILIPLWQRVRQAIRAENLADSSLCQAKLDEALLRIRALDLSIQDLTKRANDWENLYQVTVAQLSSTTAKLSQIVEPKHE